VICLLQRCLQTWVR
jgi:hypothetical protein